MHKKLLKIVNKDSLKKCKLFLVAKFSLSYNICKSHAR